MDLQGRTAARLQAPIIALRARSWNAPKQLLDWEAPAVLGRIISPVLMMMASSMAMAQPPSPSSSAAPSLKAVSGRLEHVFSIPFRGEPATISMISGLESLTFARTSDGGAIKIELDNGVRFQGRVTAVSVIANAGVVAGQLIDPLKSPSEMPLLTGYRLVGTFRIPGRDSYLAAWRNLNSGSSSLTVWGGNSKAGKLTLVAKSSSSILAAAVQISPHSQGLTIVVWAKGSAADEVVVGMYLWTDENG